MNEIGSRSCMGAAAGLAAGAVGLGHAAYYAWTRSPVLLFISVLASWTSYLLAHRALTGTLVDAPGTDQGMASGHESPLLVGLGTAVLVGGMSYGAYTLRPLGTAGTVPAACVFITGYTVAHYGATGEII